MSAGGLLGRRVALANLGCRVNRVEVDAMALALQERGAELVGQREAEAVIVNTCAVTGEAQAKTRKAVRHACGLPQRPWIVATGCAASLFASELEGLGERVVVERDKSLVVERVASCLAKMPMARSEAHEPIARRTTPTGRTRPGIKIQDGCDLRCTYCIVWKARGRSRSVAPEAVLEEVRAAQARGAHEVVLTGINLGCYRAGAQDGNQLGLPGLLSLVLRETDVERIRLSSIEPPDVTDELVAVMAGSGGRIAPFLHVCLQSGCDRTLREMGRIYDTAAYVRVVGHARATLPDLALGTDLIVGFPGETDDDFARSYAFCEEMAFSKMHVFRYSRRPGTPAAARDDQVDPQVIAARSARMLELAGRMRLEQATRHMGHEELVLVQHRGRGVSAGLFDVLVDETLPLDELVRVTPTAVLDDGTLDARTSTIIKDDATPQDTGGS